MSFAGNLMLLYVLSIYPMQTKPTLVTMVFVESSRVQVQLHWENPVLTKEQYMALAKELHDTDGITGVIDTSAKTVEVALDIRKPGVWNLLKFVLKPFLGEVHLQQSRVQNIGRF